MRLEVPGPLDPMEGGPDRHGVGEVVPGTSALDLRKADRCGRSVVINQISDHTRIIKVGVLQKK